MTYFNSLTTIVIRDVSLLRHTLVVNKYGQMHFDFKQYTPVWLKIFPSQIYLAKLLPLQFFQVNILIQYYWNLILI